MKPQTILTISLSIMALPTTAQITTDGTLGPSINLEGPNFQIGAELGRQHGPNLFHSFRDFNLNSHESATFSGPNSVQNILSRVTGGNPSHIDGLFRSTIPNANLYFLNPYGIMFGPNARLDVQGSFHASTADYLRLGDNGRFDARQPSQSLLKVAPVEAFGFLTNNPAPLTTQDSQLSIPKEQTFSLIGGSLRFSNTQLSTPSGRINLASVASPAEVIPSQTGLNISLDTPGGSIIASNNTQITTSGNRGGNVFIRGGRFELMSSQISSNTLGEQDGGITDIRVDNLSLLQGGGIFAETKGTGKGGSIVLDVTDSLILAGEGEILFKRSDTYTMSNVISTTSFSAGQGGNIDIHARQITLKNGSNITSDVFGDGKGGTITLKVTETLELSGVNSAHDVTSKDWVYGGSSIGSTSGTRLAKAQGDGGSILIEAGRVTMSEGAYISTQTFGLGNGGSIIIRVKDTLALSGAIPNAAAITTASVEGSRGHAGSIEIEAVFLRLTNNSFIATLTDNSSGDAGALDIFVTDTLTISGTKKEGFGGITSASSDEESDDEAGDAGNIVVRAGTLNLNGSIETSADNAAGGNITVITPNLLYLRGGEITTSVKGGKGDGGNITISHPVFVVLDKGQIKAQADAGHGGNIRIVAEQFIKSPCSLVSASSRLGLDGDVQIDSPSVDMDSFLVVLPAAFVKSNQLQPPCRSRIAEKQSRFVIVPSEGTSNAVGDLLPSGPLLSDSLPIKTATFIKNPPNKLALSTSHCKREKPNPSPSKKGKDTTARPSAHKGLASQPQATPESSVIDEQLF
ncbi:MAG: hypothetical protein DRR08_25225 [Candidatus Parabeggiatoa sp. nov. 2]|nr:MAG: hypothetical protein B6247_03400 [Beggiatoa sp. 4572_84]RKZ55109.1 MAG: hypothetical protein DRR08_25225 [Gammaproteobacteria bacterium]